MSTHNTWLRKTSERPFAHKLRGVRYTYKDGKCVAISSLSGRDTEVERKLVDDAKKKALIH
jgi:hypothetical protein